jgi:uncharacterized membrane protein YoaK (UPF0700 family)
LFWCFYIEFLAEWIAIKRPIITCNPISLEITILLLVGIFGVKDLSTSGKWIAFSMLFSMGVQNSMTQISNSIVRTTHLTGLFTDLGIELSQLFLKKQTKKLMQVFI